MTDALDIGKATIDAVNAFRAHRIKAESALQEIQDQIERLERERDDLLSSPATCQDLISAAQAHITSIASAGRDRIAKTISGHLRRGFQSGQAQSHLTARMLTWDQIRESTDRGSLGRAGNALATFADPGAGYFDDPKFDGVGLIAILEEPIKALLAKQIAESWPNELADVVPGELREVRLAQIVLQLDGLAIRRDELAGQIAQALAG